MCVCVCVGGLPSLLGQKFCDVNRCFFLFVFFLTHLSFVFRLVVDPAGLSLGEGQTNLSRSLIFELLFIDGISYYSSIEVPLQWVSNPKPFDVLLLLAYKSGVNQILHTLPAVHV